jgi:hypothetical protein
MSETRDEALLAKETALTAEIENVLPDFARSCRGSEDLILIHQDSFAADYEDHEYTLFGKALSLQGSTEKKYALSAGTGKRSRARRRRSFNKSTAGCRAENPSRGCHSYQNSNTLRVPN